MLLKPKLEPFFFNNTFKFFIFFLLVCGTKIGTILIYFKKLDLKVLHKSKKPTNIGSYTFLFLTN